ncbi:MAG TPA: hypothetical protein VGM82_06425 [Gemmatimonadaceae bacterium]|jgi:hypothetical protein
MARNYHVDIAAFAAGADRKWVDNLLSHFSVPGVESEKQGVARRLSIEAVQTVVLVRALSTSTGLSVDRALSTATTLLDATDDLVANDDAWITLHFDRSTFQADVDRRIAAAVESVVPKRRGRPPAGVRKK